MGSQGLRYLSLFSGIEAATVAWKPLGWEAVAFAQYEPGDNIQFPSKVLQYHYPEVPNLGDVTRITEEQIAALGHIDIVVGGSPCFVKGTMVLTESGYKPIEEIEVGELVLTHKGNLKKVVRVGHKEADTFSLQSAGRTETIVTGNHPYYTRKRTWEWGNKTNSRHFSDPTWTEVSDLNKDYFLATPVIPDLHDDERLDDETLWILGRYIADGHYRKDLRKEGTNHYQYQVIISVGKDKLEDFKAHVRSRHFSCYEHSQSVFRCTFSSMELVNIIEEYGIGDHSYNKQIPLKLLGLQKEKLSVLLEGYWSGDGCVTKKGHSATTVSEKLALTLALAIVKVHGVMPVVCKSNVPPKTVICGREVNQRPFYTIRWNKSERTVWTKDQDFLWSNVRSVTPSAANVVYNLEVEDDHTYIANNAVVHNCQDLSIAGAKRGLRNEDGSLTRSGLFDYQMQIFEWAKKHGNARFCLWENVPGAFSSNEGNDFAYILGSMVQGDVPVPGDGWGNSGVAVSESGDRCVEWHVLDTQYTGIPQRRRRVFALLDTGSWWSRPPILFKPEGLYGNPKKSKGTRKAASRTVGKDIGADGLLGGLFGDGGDGFRGTGRESDGRGSSDDGVSPLGKAYGFYPQRKAESQCFTKELMPALTIDTNPGFQNGVCIRNDKAYAMTTGNFTGVGETSSPTLMMRDYKDPTLVCYKDKALAIRMANTKANGNGFSEDVAHTLACSQPEVIAYRLDPTSSNSMKSSNPNSGFHEENVCCTLDTSTQNPVKGQGGMVIVQPESVAIPIDRRNNCREKGNSGGIGSNGDPAFTITCPGGGCGIQLVLAEDKMVLMDQGGSVMTVDHDRTGTIRAEMGGHPPIVLEPTSTSEAGNGIS